MLVESLWEISYPRENPGHFRLVNTVDRQQEYHVTHLEGLAKFRECDTKQGRVTVQTLFDPESCMMTYDEVPIVIVPDHAKELVGGGYWRFCYRRLLQDLMIRDEVNMHDPVFVNNLYGIARVHWYDGSRHLYHVGKMYLADGDAYLVPQPYGVPINIPGHVKELMESK